MKQGGKRKGAGRKAVDGQRNSYKKRLPIGLMQNEYVKPNATRAIIEGLKMFIAQKEALKQTPELKHLATKPV